tara:strand:- start:2559 stop:3422 length:864 start_codon:yes stop_codon:yes gene_type:complete
MIIVKIIGGIGNQMFQYAFYKNLSEKYENVKCDIIGFDRYKLFTGFELEKKFDIQVKIANAKEISNVTDIHSTNILTKVKRKFTGKLSTHILESEFTWDCIDNNKNLYLDGYWQNESYFGDVHKLKNRFKFKQDLNFENLKLVDSINSCNSVSMHIRRGDYVDNPVYALCDEFYYKNSIKYLQNQIKDLVLFVFSNDMLWVRSILLPILDSDLKVFLVENNNLDSSIDMRLMSLCKINIIANSSFSWWGAWLNINKEKLVIAPKKWYNDENQNFKQIQELPQSWTTI